MNHHELSMSNWVKWELCPCATSTDTPSVEAESGTRSHAHLANIIAENHLNVAVADIPELTADERARAEWAFMQISQEAGTTARINSETKVTIMPGAVGITRIPKSLEGITGWCDAWFLKGGILHVFDYKTYAMGETDYTAQVGGYALALATMLVGEEEITGFKLYTLNGGNRTMDVTRAGLREIVERSERIVESRLVNRENFEKAACNKFCKYCAHAKECPAADRALAVVKDTSVFSKLSLAKQMVIVKEVKSICERVEKDVKAILDHIAEEKGVEAAVLSDGEVTWRYKERAGAGVLSDVTGLAEACAANGVTPADLMDCAKFSKTSICDKLIACNSGMKASAAKKIIEPFYTVGKPSRMLERVR